MHAAPVATVSRGCPPGPNLGPALLEEARSQPVAVFADIAFQLLPHLSPAAKKYALTEIFDVQGKPAVLSPAGIPMSRPSTPSHSEPAPCAPSFPSTVRKAVNSSNQCPTPTSHTRPARKYLLPTRY